MTAIPGTGSLPAHDVTDLGRAAEGVRRIEWAEREMPVLRLIRERFAVERPLAGVRVGACLHVTSETANLMRTLKAAGAEVTLAASNPLSTQDDVAAALVAEYGISTYARRGEDRDTYFAHLNAVADILPQLTMDDGCD
ncbi:MAG: adenosylhomocysteinase, partial [Chloroflexota bacterium]